MTSKPHADTLGFMTDNDYVSLELAKQLKEKGFEEPCDRLYNEKEECYEYSCYTASKKGFKNSDLCDYEVAIPSLYDVQKWLRERHNIHLDVRCTTYCKPLNRHDYMCEIFALSFGIFSDTKVFHKYEEALSAGIEEALKLI